MGRLRAEPRQPYTSWESNPGLLALGPRLGLIRAVLARSADRLQRAGVHKWINLQGVQVPAGQDAPHADKAVTRDRNLTLG